MIGSCLSRSFEVKRKWMRKSWNQKRFWRIEGLESVMTLKQDSQNAELQMNSAFSQLISNSIGWKAESITNVANLLHRQFGLEAVCNSFFCSCFHPTLVNSLFNPQKTFSVTESQAAWTSKLASHTGLEFHFWTCWKGKAIFTLQRALPLENLNVKGKLLKGTKAKTRGNGGHVAYV